VLRPARRFVLWIVAVLAVTVVVSIGTPLIGSRTFFGADVLKAYAPWNQDARRDFRPHDVRVADTVNAVMPMRAEFRGRILGGDYPLWTSLPSGGVPLGTVPNFGALSPLSAAYLLAPLWYAPALSKLLEMVVAAGFTFLFLRRLGLGPAASLVGGLVYMNSGFLVSWTNWPQSQVGSLIPVLFWATERGLQARTVRGWIPVALTTGVLFLGGFPVVATYAIIGAGLYVAIRATATAGERPAERARPVGVFSLAVIVGVGIAAAQLLPFTAQVTGIDLSYREQTPRTHIPPRAVMTLAIPNALGSPVDANYFGRLGLERAGYGPATYHEVQSFLGMGALVLIVAGGVALTRRGADPLPPRTTGYLWGASVAMGALMYGGGAPLGLLQRLPLFGLSFVGRLRSVFLLFLATLAAVGFELVLREDRAPSPGRLIRRAIWFVAAAAFLFGLWRMWDLAGEAGLRRYVGRQSLIPLAAGVVTVAAVALGRRAGRGGAPLVAAVVPVVMAVESLAFVVPYWPRQERGSFYPTTSAHRFLQENLGQSRFVGADFAMYPGTASMYGLRSATAHTFPDPAWADMVRAANGGSVPRDLNPRMRPDLDVATSPILDRMAVRYLVVSPDDPVFGRPQQVGEEAGSVVLRPGQPLTTAFPGVEPVRAVELRVLGGMDSVGPVASVAVEIRDAAGRVLARAERRLPRRLRQGRLSIAFPEPQTAGGRTATATEIGIALSAAGGGVLRLPADRSSRPVLSVVGGQDDGLRLVFAQGVCVYERVDALPRVRWASRGMVVEGTGRRLQVLGAGVAPDVVVLNEEGDEGSGLPGEVRLVRDVQDELRIEVSAQGDGYVVVADALQRGWTAYVDGSPSSLVPADHGVVAVPVAKGEHTVTLRYEPRRWRVGLLISAASLLLLAGVALLGWSRGRGRRSAGT
jgi:hypothetical protein